MTVVHRSAARSALGFLTIAGLGTAGGPDHRTAAWFAPVGAAVGLVVGAAWWGAAELWPPLLAGAVAVAVDVGMTGLLHFDGLADTADGLLPPMDRSRRLEVMADPRTGGFAVVTVGLVLVLRVGTLGALEPDPLLLAGLWAAARALMGVTMATVPYARRHGGLATAFGDTPLSPTLVGASAGLALVIVALGVPAGPVVALSLPVAMTAVVALAWRRLGGFTGDVLGAAGLVGETVALLVAAARW